MVLHSGLLAPKAFVFYLVRAESQVMNNCSALSSQRPFTGMKTFLFQSPLLYACDDRPLDLAFNLFGVSGQARETRHSSHSRGGQSENDVGHTDTNQTTFVCTMDGRKCVAIFDIYGICLP